ncbi:MAG: motility associated factor glycosyltransferase family protein [Lachnospiraceae bacterium]|nr:motility associated factor glycosyltransferase family protein [Lachnospiraceae bacterium]
METRDLISLAQNIIHKVHIQNYHGANLLFRSLLAELGSCYQEEVANNPELSEVMSMLLQALENMDFVLVADLLEDGLIPYLQALLQIDEAVVQGRYCLEMGSKGYYTLKAMDVGVYLHSNTNPVIEARELIEECYDPGYEEYVVWGLGLGYHVDQLWQISRKSIKIKVFEEDEQVIRIAKQIGILKDIPETNLQLICDVDGRGFASELAQGNKGILMHLASIRKCVNKDLKDALQRFFTSWNSGVHFKTELAVNFRKNQNHCQHVVDQIESQIRGKEVILVAGGPSVDSKLEYLKEMQGKKIIFAATTILRKLLQENIHPDYVVVMDSQTRTYGHMAGIENIAIPLICDSTAYWEFAANNLGVNYIAYQKGYEASEQKASEGNCRTYDTGGSVTTLMLDIVLQLGAKEVAFIGADFAYPGGVTHAKNTMDRKVQSTDKLEQVESVSGDMVYTDGLMSGYRQWIERKIEEYPKVTFLNMSDCGAKIKGTKWVGLS